MQLVSAAVNFKSEVRPIFEEHCYRCHGAKKQKSSLRLDVREAALEGGEYYKPNIAPGKAGESNLIEFVTGKHEEGRMPPKGEGLSSEEIATLTAWINEGAVWPEGIDEVQLEDRTDHWSFKPLKVFKSGRSLDSFIIAELREHGLTMSDEAGRVTWLRRVYFDLIGLPPAPETVDAFLSDTRDDAHARVVDDLLDSHRYGERWAQHWLDVVRYADTHGFEVNTPRPNAWPYRDYVIEAFNHDIPFDRFIREQLAGDRMGKDAATGFLVTAARLLPGQIGQDDASKRLARQDELGEIVINTSEAFLGLSVGCARCHNHKFDAITAKDYYSLQAFFSGVSYGDRPMRTTEGEENRQEVEKLAESIRGIDQSLAGLVPLARSGKMRPAVSAKLNVERFPPVTTRKVRFTIRKANQYEPCIDELEVFDAGGKNVALSTSGAVATASGSNVAVNRHELHFVNDGKFGNERSWMCSAGEGWVMIEFPHEQTIERIVWGRDRQGKYADRLALDYLIEVADEAGKWHLVADSSDRHKQEEGGPSALNGFSPEQADKAKVLLNKKTSFEARIRELEAKRLVFGGAFGKPEAVHLLNRGDAEQPLEEVAPAVLSAFGDISLAKDAPESERRAVLADWIASPDHPLTARVAINRIWQGHFGIGFVETSNDFGRAGAKPTHPELLDWLATEFIRSGWSIKKMHRLITLSETYRQSGLINADAQGKDADVRLLWRFPSRRLEAEALRDSILAVAGQLNLKTGGPGFDLFKSRGGLSGFPPVESFAGEGLRRMIYAHKIRMEPDSIFGAFDCPDAGQSVSRRRQSTTPIQALNLFNSQFVIDCAEDLAKRVKFEAGEDLNACLRRAYKLSLAREPSDDEIADALPVVREHGLAALCRALMNSNEFLFIP